METDMRRSSCKLFLLGLLTALAFSAPSSSLAQTDDAEISFWNSVKDSKDAAELQAYLEAYPEGVFAPLARIRLNSLEAGATAKPKQETTPPASVSEAQSTDKPPIHDCDRLAANPSDQEHVGEGIAFANIRPEIAIAACKEAIASFPDEPRFAFQLARAKYAQEDYASASEIFRELAEKGYAAAMNGMGYVYWFGKGAQQDRAAGLEWYRKAAEHGNPDAMVHLGFAYTQGELVEKDDRRAIEWYRKAADTGHTPAMLNLGYAYEQGQGVEKDARVAVEWYRKAAKKGHAGSMVNLGFAYENGTGVERDDRIAVEWYRKAAALNHSLAFHNLGGMLDRGRGVAKDRQKAAEYMFKALKAKHKFSRTQMIQNSKIWSVEFRRELQRLLKEEGHYSGAIDGAFGPATRAAIEGLMSSVEVPQPSSLSRDGNASQPENEPELTLPEIGDVKELETLD